MLSLNRIQIHFAFQIKNLNISLVNKNICTASTHFNKKGQPNIPKKWLTYNEKIFPPQELGEERRPAFVCHMKTNMKYSYKKLWYVAVLVRGMKVDEALEQLKFIKGKKGPIIVKDTIEEAKQLAVKEHNVEFPSNMWVAESFVGKGYRLRGMRRHARMRVGQICHDYVHYFVRLEEGDPPEHYYYWKRPLSVQEKLDKWLQEQRERTIPFVR